MVGKMNSMKNEYILESILLNQSDLSLNILSITDHLVYILPSLSILGPEYLKSLDIDNNSHDFALALSLPSLLL